MLMEYVWTKPSFLRRFDVYVMTHLSPSLSLSLIEEMMQNKSL